MSDRDGFGVERLDGTLLPFFADADMAGAELVASHEGFRTQGNFDYVVVPVRLTSNLVNCRWQIEDFGDGTWGWETGCDQYVPSAGRKVPECPPRYCEECGGKVHLHAK